MRRPRHSADHLRDPSFFCPAGSGLSGGLRTCYLDGAPTRAGRRPGRGGEAVRAGRHPAVGGDPVTGRTLPSRSRSRLRTGEASEYRQVFAFPRVKESLGFLTIKLPDLPTFACDVPLESLGRFERSLSFLILALRFSSLKQAGVISDDP